MLSRSCAASTAGSNKSAGDSGPLSCSPSGLRTFVEYVRDWVQSAFTSSGFGVELAILWILLGNHQVEYWRLGFPVILRLCGVHIPISWCRLLTCVSVGSVVWESSSWAMRGLWMIYLWYHPSFPEHADGPPSIILQAPRARLPPSADGCRRARNCRRPRY